MKKHSFSSGKSFHASPAKFIALLALAWMSFLPVRAQLLAGKTNALLWANFTPNLSLELVTSEHTSLSGSLFYSPTHTTAKVGIKGADIQLRYWFSGRPLAQSFLAVGLQGMKHNVTAFSDYQHNGFSAGPGLVYGYALPLTKRFNLEFTAGMSVMWFKERKYQKGTPDPQEYNHTGKKLMPMGIGVSCVYIFK